MSELTYPDAVHRAIEDLGPWFHNLHLPSGAQTAPAHALGDFPQNKWNAIADHLPRDLSEWSVLDVGCNAGFYSFELARRGAAVTAVDCDPHYLRQARWAARQFEVGGSIDFREQQVYQLAEDPDRYDLVWFMGVFYHLRYPLLALDLLASKTRRMMVFQTLTMPGKETAKTPEDVGLEDRELLLQEGWPKMAFLERRLAADPTNWWAPNHACVEAMLRSSGLRVVERPAHEIYLCEPTDADPEGMRELNEQQFFAALGESAERNAWRGVR